MTLLRGVLLLLPQTTRSSTFRLPQSRQGPINHRFFATRLSGKEKVDALATLAASSSSPLSRWEAVPTDRDAIMKTYEFKDFKQAWDWMGKVAVLAEKMNHHPEWKNIYNMVEVTLTTHDCDGLSAMDIQMAQSMDEFASEILPKRDEDK